MKLLIIRHGDPDYEIDGLTEKGKREAELLSERLCKEDIKAFYCSTLGRAIRTAEPTLNKLGINAEYCPWLREFDYAKVKFPYLDKQDCCWDVLPDYIETLPKIYSPTEWREAEFLKNSSVPESYDNVIEEFDNVLAKFGYVRDGYSYRAKKPNHYTIAFVCHYGLASVLVSHILNCSPYSIWQNCFMPPSSVTTFYTEERIEGIASLRCSGMGDISHLYKVNEETAFSGRFCECFTDNTRHH